MRDDWEEEDDWEAADPSLPQTGGADQAEWSDEEAHTAEPEPLHPAAAPKPAAPPREKTALEKKIEEREMREVAEAARMAALREAAGLATEIDPSLTGAAAEKARRKLLQEAADFDNAAAAFGLDVAAEIVKAKPPAASEAEAESPAAAEPEAKPPAAAEPEAKPPAVSAQPAPAPAAAAQKPAPAASATAKTVVVAKAEAVKPVPKTELPDSFMAKTDQEFEALAEDLNSRLAPYAGRSGHMKLLKAFLRKAAEGMTTEEVKELSTFASIQYNDKVKADRDKDKKGKKTKKGTIKIAAGKDVDNDFGGLDGDGGGAGWRANEDLDFM